jgi:hypothetical protein
VFGRDVDGVGGGDMSCASALDLVKTQAGRRV